jgi:YVTN family beta-propeller protein
VTKYIRWDSTNGRYIEVVGPANNVGLTDFTTYAQVGFEYYGITDDGESVWMSRFSSAIQKINRGTGAIEATYTMPSSPNGILYAFGSLWVACDGDLIRVNPSTGATDATITISASGNLGEVQSDGTNIWVSDLTNDTVKKVSPGSNTVTATVAVLNSPRDLMFDGTALWVSRGGSGTISKINVTTNVVSDTVALTGSTGNGDLVMGDGYLWVASTTADKVFKVDVSTNTEVDSIAVTNPVAIAHTDAHLWVVAGTTVSRVDTISKTTVDTFTVASDIEVMYFDGIFIWVGHNNGGGFNRIFAHSYVRQITPDAVSVSSAYTPVICADGTVLVDTSAGSVTITLPTAVYSGDCPVTIKKMSAANTMNIATTSSQTIDGSASTIPVTVQYEAVTVMSDGTNWTVV